MLTILLQAILRAGFHSMELCSFQAAMSLPEITVIKPGAYGP